MEHGLIMLRCKLLDSTNKKKVLKSANCLNSNNTCANAQCAYVKPLFCLYKITVYYAIDYSLSYIQCIIYNVYYTLFEPLLHSRTICKCVNLQNL